MTKIRRLEPYGFNEQPQFNGLANTVKANIENIKEKNQEQDKKDESQDENIKQAIDKSVVSLEMLSTPTEGSNRTYAVKQGGNEIGKIEIPFSSLVKSTTYDAEKNLLIFTIDNDKDIKVNLTGLIEDADLVQRRIFDDFKNEVNSFSSNTTDSISELVQKLGSGFTGANTVTSVIERNEKVVSASLNDLNDRKLDASAYTPTDLSDYYKKEETSGKTELTAAFNSKANKTDLDTHISDGIKHITGDERTKWDNAVATLTTHTGDSTVHITAEERTNWNGKISSVQYSKTDNKIYFYSGATTESSVANIDATDFIKDGMVSNVEIKDVTDSGSCLVITFNADAGKQDINIPISTIFNPSNYYLKTETSGSTELNTAFGLKANQSDFTAHTNDSTIHVTSDDKTKWNNAATSSHTHANKDVLDKITAIDTELSETSNNLVVSSAITKVLIDNEKVVSASLNDLNDRKLDVSAYTKTDLSDYYKKGETSGATEISTALGKKQDTLTAGNGLEIANNTISVTLDTTLFKVVDSLPTSGDNKIYLVPTTGETDTDDIYTEYLYANSKWERIGALNKKIDLSGYLKTEDAKKTYATIATTNALQTSIDEKQDKGNYVSATTLNNYYTKNESDGKYITETELTTKNYITGVDLSNYDTIANVDTKLKKKLDASAYTEPDFETLISKSNSVKALTNLPTDKYSILATISASGDAQSISFDSIPAEGSEYMIDVYNTSGSDITLTYPTDNYQVDSTTLTLPNGKITSISVRYVFGKYVIKA